MIDSTAMGTDADTVMPTLSTRYSDEAPKMMPSTAPTQHRRPGELVEVGVGGDVGLVAFAALRLPGAAAGWGGFP